MLTNNDRIEIKTLVIDNNFDYSFLDIMDKNIELQLSEKYKCIFIPLKIIMIIMVIQLK